MKYLIFLLLLSGCATKNVQKNCFPSNPPYSMCDKLGLWE